MYRGHGCRPHSLYRLNAGYEWHSYIVQAPSPNKNIEISYQGLALQPVSQEILLVKENKEKCWHTHHLSIARFSRRQNMLTATEQPSKSQCETVRMA